jgi:hypothetical protein
MTMDEIQAEVNNMEKESKALKKELYKMAWFMRGSLSFEEVFQLDLNDREAIAEIIKENLETTKSSGLSFF